MKRGEIEIEFEGDKDFVEKHYGEYKKELLKINNKVSPKDGSKSLEELEKESPLERLSLVEFYKEKQPQDHNENIVVFAYWITEKEVKKEFTSGDIIECYKIATIKKPAKISNYIRELTSPKKAYLIKGDSKRTYKLSLTGREFVEKELPKKIEI